MDQGFIFIFLLYHLKQRRNTQKWFSSSVVYRCQQKVRLLCSEQLHLDSVVHVVGVLSNEALVFMGVCIMTFSSEGHGHAGGKVSTVPYSNERLNSHHFSSEGDTTGQQQPEMIKTRKSFLISII